MVYVVPMEGPQSGVKKEPVDVKQERNILKSLQFIMIFARVLALLPQENVQSPYSSMKLKWRNWKVVHTVFMLANVTFLFGVWTVYLIEQNYSFGAFASACFYLGSNSTLIVYLHLAKSWPTLITAWCQIENIMRKNYGYPRNLDLRLRLYSAIFLGFTAVDHFLSVGNRYSQMRNKWGSDYTYAKYYEDYCPMLYRLISVNIFSAAYYSFFSLYATILWAFNDLFIILLSTALAMRFQQINERVAAHFRKANSEAFWVEIRKDYYRLCVLCEEVDNNLSFIILLSYSINILFILIQLFYSLRVVDGLIGKIYFYYSFLYLIMKVVLVSLFAARINDESQKPAKYLNAVSSQNFNIEIRRLLTQISLDNVALTGGRMFKINRGILLSIAGAIVTYELVLLQFYSIAQG